MPNMRKIFLSVLVLTVSLHQSILFAQPAMGAWEFYVSTAKVTQTVQVNGKVYAAYLNGLLEFDLSSGEKTLFHDINGLSDINISALGTVGSTLIIGYDNGNIDLYDGTSIRNIPDIRLAQIQSSKRINTILEWNNQALIGTGFGMVRVNLSKREIVETYFPNSVPEVVVSCALHNNRIYASNGSIVYSADANNPVLSNPDNWSVDPLFPSANGFQYAQLLTVKESLFLLKDFSGNLSDSIYKITSTLEPFGILPFKLIVNSISRHDDRLALNLLDGLVCFRVNDGSLAYNLGAYAPGKTYEMLHSTFLNERIFVGTVKNGLVQADVAGNYSTLPYPGPPANTYYSLDIQKNTVAVSGGGLSGIANTFNPDGVYILKEGEWTQKKLGTVADWEGKIIYDFLCSAIDPKSGKIAIGTYSHEPVLALDENGNGIDTYNPTNSTLEYSVLGNGNGLVSDMLFDAQGNLWVLNGYAAQGLLKCMDVNGNWYSYNLGSSSSGFRTKNLVIDNNGNLWSSVIGKGLYGYKTNETLDNLQDDKNIELNIGESTGALPSNTVTSLAVDFDNELWIGTESGFAILYDPDGAFDAAPGEYNAQRIKVEFEGNVEFLLGSTNISAIVVDGGNRKWMGTEGAGIFCLSADGNEILKEFTTENSPLISNFIVDMAINQSTGEMFVITDKGLVSLRIDASYGDPNYSNVVVFPNPVRPEFNGLITIQGIQFDSDVKFTDAAGNVVYQTTSNGGTAVWDGNRFDGTRVSTGVYFIYTAPNDGKGKYVGKVAIVSGP